MLVQLRGTSGSGKSTAMRQVMDALADHYETQWVAEYSDGRRRPLYYRHAISGAVVLGHYDSPCGGCDTIGSARAVHDLITSTFPQGATVVCEGLLLSEDVKWTAALHEAGWDVRVLYLTTPLGQCLAWIRGRRAAAGNDKPLSETNTANRVATIERSRVKLIEAGVWCCRCSVNQAPRFILDLLRLHARQGGHDGPGTDVGVHAVGR